MQKRFLISISALLTLSLLIAVLIFYPKQIDINAEGLKYRLGTEDKESEKQVNVKVKGKLHKSISGERKFVGTVEIEGEEMPVPLSQRELNIPITSDGWGAIDYPFIKSDKNTGETTVDIYSYGSMFISEELNVVAVLITDQSQINENGSAVWNAEDGQIITAPASSRSEAINISNELMKPFLKGYTLK